MGGGAGRRIAPTNPSPQPPPSRGGGVSRPPGVVYRTLALTRLARPYAACAILMAHHDRSPPQSRRPLQPGRAVPATLRGGDRRRHRGGARRSRRTSGSARISRHDAVGGQRRRPDRRARPRRARRPSGEPSLPTLEELAAAGCYAALVPGPADGLTEAARRTGVRVLGPHSVRHRRPGHRPERQPRAYPAAARPPRAGVAIRRPVPRGDRLGRAERRRLQPYRRHRRQRGYRFRLGPRLALPRPRHRRHPARHPPAEGPPRLPVRRPRRRPAAPGGGDPRRRPAAGRRRRTGDLAFEAALRRAGVLSVRHLEDLLAAAETLSRARPARGEALAIVTNAIGAGRSPPTRLCEMGIALADLPGTRRWHRPRAGRGHGATRGDHRQRGAGTRCWRGAGGACAPPARRTRPRSSALIAAAPSMPRPAAGLRHGRDHRGSASRHAGEAAGLAVFAMPAQAVRGFQHLVRDRRNRAAARELPPSTVLSRRARPQRGAPPVRPGATRRTAGAVPGRGAGRTGGLRHPHRSDALGHASRGRARGRPPAGLSRRW